MSKARVLRNAGTDTGDILDRLAQNGASEEDARRAAEEGAEQAQAGVVAQDRPHLSDDGNARRFVERCGDRIRYLYERKTWHAWDGRSWAPDATGEVERYAKDTVRALYAEASEIEDQAARDTLVKFAVRSEAAQRIDAMIKLARSERRVVLKRDDLDANPWALNTRSGIVDLLTGELRPHDPDELHSKIAAAAYRSDAVAPQWQAFLERVLPDEEVRHYFHKLAGYSCAGVIGENVLPFGYGSGANGKSVAFHVIRDVLGDYATEAAPDLLVARKERGIPADVADLRGYRFVTTLEVEGGRRMATDVMKRITGDHTLKARRLYQGFAEFRNETTLWMAGNDRPAVDGLDEAIWRRVRLIPFTVTIPERERDPDLAAKLLTERDGILGWLIDGIRRYHDEGLEAPKAVRAATDEYREESNPLGDWFEAECEPNTEASTPAHDLRESYERYCRTTRRTPIPQRSPKWSAGLKRLGCTEARTSTERRWKGVRLQRDSTGLGL